MADNFIEGCEIKLGIVEEKIDLLSLDIAKEDIIIRMDWLHQNQIRVDCGKIELKFKDG